MKSLRYFMLILAAVVCGNIFAQKSQQELNQLMQERNEYYFTFNLSGNDDLNAIAQTISVDRVDGKVVTAYANNKEFADFQQLGYETTLQTPPSLMEKVAMWDGSNRAEYDWDSYPTYTAYEEMMFQFATDHPDKCEIITLGTLPSGRKIMIAHLNNGSGEGKPKFLYTSTIHGDETTGWILMLRLIDYLLENPDEPEVQTVMDNIDLYIGPNTNPDGTYHAGNNNVNGATRYNANGVDMNRNYADPHGSAHPDGEEYQQETLWFMQFADENAFVMGANYHGGAEVMNYPWDNTYTLHPDDAWYQLISHEYADLTHEVNPNYMNDFNNGITNGAQWYMIGGGRQDYMNGYAQCRELTIECSNTKLPNGNQLPNFWNINKNSIFAFMNQCLYGIHGTVTDASTGEPIEATITISGHDNTFSVVESHLPAGDFHRPIKGGTYTVSFIADGYRPHQETVTVADYETVNLNVALEAGAGILPDFSVSRTMVPLGGHVNFTDQSFGDIVSWHWTFEGAGSSTQQNPTNVSYDMVGDFAVTLTVTDSNGNTETLTRNNYIHVREAYMMQDGTFETCRAFFYASAYTGYHSNEDYTLTFLPDTPGNKISVNFLSFSTEANYDWLEIYDGSSTDAPFINSYSGNDEIGIVTATNEEGALTFHFTSDYYTTSSGWEALVDCVGSYEPMIIDVTANPEVINEGESSQLTATVTGGAGNYTFRWEPVETLDYPTSCCPIATPTEHETIYKVEVTDGEGNTVSGEVTVTIRNVGMDENTMSALKVYPNPNNGLFIIEGNADYQLINSLGQVVLSGVCEGKCQIDAQGLKQGVYFLRLNGENDCRTEKIIIE